MASQKILMVKQIIQFHRLLNIYTLYPSEIHHFTDIDHLQLAFVLSNAIENHFISNLFSINCWKSRSREEQQREEK